jgi:hypothetical protein
MNELWTDLVTTAVLGTERRTFVLPAVEGALGEWLERIDLADREGALLSMAAIVALARQAGRLPTPHARASASPSDEEDLPLCPERAVQHLVALLGGGAQRGLLPEWLAALASRGRRVPAAQLPALLDLGRVQPDMRAAILPVLGKRGVWLAGQNPDWGYASSEFSVMSIESMSEQLQSLALEPFAELTFERSERLEGKRSYGSELKTLWETGTRAARAALLINVRKYAPELARDLLKLTWATEKADDRAAFISTFEHNLSMDDEPLLESLLDDRSKEVRRAVASLLMRLPESRLVARMIARAQPLLSVSADAKSRLRVLRLGQSTRLVVVPPADCDAAMLRDGIEPHPPAHRKKLGEKAWLLIQVLGAAPPSMWSQQWQLAPAELIQAAARSEWKHALIEGWRAAALNTQDAEWAAALLADDLSAADLIDALPPERQEVLLLGILRADCTPLHKHPVLDLLRKTRHTWSADLTRAVLRALHRHMRKWKDTYDYQLRGALTDEFARRMPPALLPEIAAGWPEETDVRERWQGVIDKLLITLQFRHDMLEALHSA